MPSTENDSKKFIYKSPPLKLVTFFKKSRDNWKNKYIKTKYRAKLLADKVRYWKEQNAKLKQQVKKLEKELEESEKKTRKEIMGGD